MYLIRHTVNMVYFAKNISLKIIYNYRPIYIKIFPYISSRITQGEISKKFPLYPRFPGTLTLFIASVGIDYIITMRIYAKA